MGTELDFNEVVRQVAPSAQAFGLLAERVVSLRDRLVPARAMWGGRTDSRRMVLGNLYRPCLTMPTFILNMLKNVSGESDLQMFSILIELNEGREKRRHVFSDFVIFTTLGSVVEFQFQLENFFRNVIRHLGMPRQGYKESATELTKLAGLDVSRIEPITCLSHLRNALHNNGVHAKEDYSCTFEAVIEHGSRTIRINPSTLTFERGKRVDSRGPLAVVALFSLIIDLLADIIASDALKAIDGPILDDYAEQARTAK